MSALCDTARLEALSQGVRNDDLNDENLTAQLHAWAEAYPHLARVRSLGRSEEGRERWLLTVGPEPDPEGAGAFPTSEPEARAFVDFVTAHPEILAWLDLHTLGGVFIRPRGDAPEKNMDPSDLALFRPLEERGKALTGYPTASGWIERRVEIG